MSAAQFRVACTAALDTLRAVYSDKPAPGFYGYAYAYLKQVPYLLDHELYAQGQYILSNLGAWRGGLAKLHKANIKLAMDHLRP
jgi:hypothetical protein